MSKINFKKSKAMNFPLKDRGLEIENSIPFNYETL